MEKQKNGFFLVREEILPEAIKKTIRVKEMLKHDDKLTINEAVKEMDLSRSAYYKYKDYVFPFYEASQNKIVTLTFLLEHKKGVLSSVLNTISSDSGSVLTINQGIPLQGVANATVSIETAQLSVDLEALLDKLRMVDGVKRSGRREGKRCVDDERSNQDRPSRFRHGRVGRRPRAPREHGRDHGQSRHTARPRESARARCEEAAPVPRRHRADDARGGHPRG